MRDRKRMRAGTINKFFFTWPYIPALLKQSGIGETSVWDPAVHADSGRSIFQVVILFSDNAIPQVWSDRFTAYLLRESAAYARL